LAALAATVLAAFQATQLHAAAAVSTSEGAGPATLSFIPPSTTIDCTTIFTLTGTAVMAVRGPAGDYVGPVTMQGTVPWCGVGIQPPVAQLVVTGSPELGDFGCGTAASPMQGFWAEPLDVITVQGSCHVAGAAVPGKSNFIFLSATPGVPNNLALAGWTDAGVALWSGS